MSRAYRLKVNQTLRRVLRAADHVSTQLELLEILPREQMVELLAEELDRRGFQRRNQDMVRNDKGVTVTIAADTGTVTVRAEHTEAVELRGEKHGVGYDDWGNCNDTKEALRDALRRDLEKEAAGRTVDLQKRVTDRLEARLGDLRHELDQVANRVTAEALKRRAAQIGQIKTMTEDPQNGSLTIVLEV